MLFSIFAEVSFSFIEHSLSTTVCLFSDSFLALLSVDRFEYLSYQLHFRIRSNGEYIMVEVDGTALVFDLGTLTTVLAARYLSPTIGLTQSRSCLRS